MRLFLALTLPENTRAHLSRLIDDLRPSLSKSKLSWTRPQNLHVTLKFLGEVDDAYLPSLCSALARIPRQGPIHLTPDHIECFPPRGPIRIITAGLAGDLAAAATLHTAIDSICHPLGFPREKRRYIPHITLARARAPLPAPAREKLAQQARHSLPAPSFSADRVTLFQSTLSPRGSEYVPVTHTDLI
jgi:RNA 2',3'-cyclic 3'-phosphodiesterase